jgi:hypothetical protein
LLANTAVYNSLKEGLLELGHEVSIVGHQDGLKLQLTTQLRKKMG